jgi:hypothetical protein
MAPKDLLTGGVDTVIAGAGADAEASNCPDPQLDPRIGGTAHMHQRQAAGHGHLWAYMGGLSVRCRYCGCLPRCVAFGCHLAADVNNVKIKCMSMMDERSHKRETMMSDINACPFKQTTRTDVWLQELVIPCSAAATWRDVMLLL